jgi:hypothetical protein
MLFLIPAIIICWDHPPIDLRALPHARFIPDPHYKVLFPVAYLLHQFKACFAAYLQRWGDWLAPGPSASHGRRKHIPDTEPEFRVINTPKPPWVREELLRMKAQMPEASCRFLAATFNRRFSVSRQMSVGKTYVAEMVKQHAYEVQVLRTDQKRRPPRPVPMHCVWGLDLTGKTDQQGNTHTLFLELSNMPVAPI